MNLLLIVNLISSIAIIIIILVLYRLNKIVDAHKNTIKIQDAYLVHNTRLIQCLIDDSLIQHDINEDLINIIKNGKDN